MTQVSSVKVLVADDDQPFCKMMEAILSTMDFISEVRSSQRGLIALYSCLDFRPEVVFIDSMMPAMDGDLLGSKVRSLLPHARLVSISGSPRKETPQWADEHVLKGHDMFHRLRTIVLGTETSAPDRT